MKAMRRPDPIFAPRAQRRAQLRERVRVSVQEELFFSSAGGGPLCSPAPGRGANGGVVQLALHLRAGLATGRQAGLQQEHAGSAAEVAAEVFLLEKAFPQLALPWGRDVGGSC